MYNIYVFFFSFYFPENRTLELHSPDSVHACVLRASDANEAGAWFNTLHSALTVLTEKALKVASNSLTTILGELKHIGWMARKPSCLVSINFTLCPVFTYFFCTKL